MMERKRISLEDQLKTLGGEDYHELLPDGTPIRALLQNDSFVKKQIGNSYKTTRRRGFDGTVITQSSYMRKNERKKLNGKVTYFDLYRYKGNIPLYITFEHMSVEDQKKVLSGFIKYCTLQEIANRMRTSTYHLINTFKALQIEIPKKRTEEVIKTIERREKEMSEIMPYAEMMEHNREDRKEIILGYYEKYGKKALNEAWGNKNVSNIINNLKINHIVIDPSRKPVIREAAKATVDDVEKAVGKVLNKGKKIISVYSLQDTELTGTNLKQRLEGIAQSIMPDSIYMVTVILKELDIEQEDTNREG